VKELGVDRIAVDLRAWDPISHAGVVSQLRLRPEVRVIDHDPETESVVVAVVDRVDDEVLTVLRRVHRAGSPRGVLVVTDIDEKELLAAAECGFIGVVRRSEASAAKLVEAIGAVARGEGHVPSDLLGNLLLHVGRSQGERINSRGMNLSRLNEREIEVLRLVAEGCSTADIALKLAYSDRTIKNVLHSVMTRLNLRTRSQAVAYAMREGLI
jgi:DNA-binding NarL/FixJ family response regulator